MTNEIVASWITAIAATISSIGIWVAIRYYKKDHDRSRRQNAVALISDWSKGLKQNASIARKFVEELSPKNAEHLWNQESFEISVNKLEMIKACLSGTGINNSLIEKGGLILLDIEVVSAIRWQVISYLNQLESILSAWRHNVADKEILEEELSYLISKESKEILKTFRNVVTGNEAYPAIDEFVKSLHPESQIHSQGKKKL